MARKGSSGSLDFEVLIVGYEHVVMNCGSARIRISSMSKAFLIPKYQDYQAQHVLIIGTSQSRQHDKSKPQSSCTRISYLTHKSISTSSTFHYGSSSRPDNDDVDMNDEDEEDIPTMLHRQATTMNRQFLMHMEQRGSLKSTGKAFRKVFKKK
nr:hypothetical protein [Tanacetum cinerariifolium]